MSMYDISEQDLAILIPRFYDRVRADAELGPIFAGAIDDWPQHLAKLVDFWSSVMLGSGRYKGQPVPAHLRHADVLTPAMFDRWLSLWHDVTAQTLPVAEAHALQTKAARIAQSLLLAIQYRPTGNAPGPADRRSA